MFRPVFASLVVLLAAGAARAQTTRVTWVGQACFYLQTEGGPTVAVDPPAPSIGYTLPSNAADVVTISHNHADHNNSAGVRGSFTLVDGRPVTQRSEMSAAGFPFVLIPGFHDNVQGAARGPNTIVVWTQGGLRFAHFGDFGQDALTDAQLADLQNIDVMMAPAGGTLTIDASQAGALAAQIKPRVLILIHWRTALGGPATLASLPAIANPFPQIRYKPATVVLSRASLPQPTEVWVMEPAAEAFVVNLAGAVPGVPVAPGSLASVQGAFAEAGTGPATNYPLETRLNNAQVLVGTTAVPLLFTSPDRVGFQVPASIAPGQNVLDVLVGGQRVARGTITTVPRSPGIFAAAGSDGRVAIGRRDGYLTLFGSGQGVVTPAVADGNFAPFDRLSPTPNLPVVTIGGRPVPVLFSGLAPGWVGLWQVNVHIPDDQPLGPGQEVAVSLDSNLPANTIRVAIEEKIESF
jgi:uncharacterized protein (TIGR03437 family)